MNSVRVLVGACLVATLAGCAHGAPRPATLETYGYSEGGHQRVACCEPRSAQTAPGFSSAEYSIQGTPWFDGAWHEGGDGVACLAPGKRTSVKIGYFTYATTKDAPGTTVITWVRCDR